VRVNAATCGRSLINGLVGQKPPARPSYFCSSGALLLLALFRASLLPNRNRECEYENQFARASKAAVQLLENQKLLFRAQAARETKGRSASLLLCIWQQSEPILTRCTPTGSSSTAAAANVDADTAVAHKYNQSPFYVFGVFPFISARSFTQQPAMSSRSASVLHQLPSTKPKHA
jgi:hypothetical protein